MPEEPLCLVHRTTVPEEPLCLGALGLQEDTHPLTSLEPESVAELEGVQAQSKCPHPLTEHQ